MSSVSSDQTLERRSGSLVLEVPDMDCASCAQRISERLEKLDGVETVDARVIAKDVRIAFDPDLLAEHTIGAAMLEDRTSQESAWPLVWQCNSQGSTR